MRRRAVCESKPCVGMCSRPRYCRARSTRLTARWWCSGEAIQLRCCNDHWTRSPRPHAKLLLQGIHALAFLFRRMPCHVTLLDEAQLTSEQQAVFEGVRSGPRGLVRGTPARVAAKSGVPERAQKSGAFCRYGTRLPARLSELAIIMVGAHWCSGFEWSVHAPIAAKAGVDFEVLEAIRVGARPSIARADEARSTASRGSCSKPSGFLRRL